MPSKVVDGIGFTRTVVTTAFITAFFHAIVPRHVETVVLLSGKTVEKKTKEVLKKR